ncbi:MAG: hypothetical protein MMC23_001475 [Stictis urceolatum]|nr:hypothetical protein [Stictis urceolata]
MSPTPQSEPFIRPYDPTTDDPAIEHIFRETCDEGVKSEPTCTIGYHIWALPYTRLCPETCFVLVSPYTPSALATSVGYILGTPSASHLASAWSSTYLPSLPSTLFPPPPPTSPIPSDKPTLSNPQSLTPSPTSPTTLLRTLHTPSHLLHPSHPSLVAEYPGHFHINVLPPYQGQGWGRELIETWMRAVSALGCRGAHLGMVEGNKAAEGFYGRLGFKRWREVMDGGQSGESGVQRGKGWGTVWLFRGVEGMGEGEERRGEGEEGRGEGGEGRGEEEEGE